MKLIEETTRHLPCQLTDDEVRRYGEDLAQMIEDIATEEARAADVKAQLKGSMTALEAQRSKLASRVRRREEHRDTRVELRLDDAGMVHVVRPDTGEEVEVRPATQGELQPAMDLGDAA